MNEIEPTLNIAIEQFLSKEEQERIGVNDDVPHTRCADLKITRILASYAALAAANKVYREALEKAKERLLGYGRTENIFTIKKIDQALAQQAPVSACNRETKDVEDTLRERKEIK